MIPARFASDVAGDPANKGAKSQFIAQVVENLDEKLTVQQAEFAVICTENRAMKERLEALEAANKHSDSLEVEVVSVLCIPLPDLLILGPV